MRRTLLTTLLLSLLTVASAQPDTATTILTRFGSSPQGTAFSSRDSTLTASPAEQLMFSLVYRSAAFWMAEADLCDREISARDSIIAVYAEVTGVQAATSDLLRQQLTFSNAVNRDAAERLPKVEAEVERLTPFVGKARRRGFVIAVSVPAALLIGFGTGVIYETIRP